MLDTVLQSVSLSWRLKWRNPSVIYRHVTLHPDVLLYIIGPQIYSVLFRISGFFFYIFEFENWFLHMAYMCMLDIVLHEDEAKIIQKGHGSNSTLLSWFSFSPNPTHCLGILFLILFLTSNLKKENYLSWKILIAIGATIHNNLMFYNVWYLGPEIFYISYAVFIKNIFSRVPGSLWRAPFPSLFLLGSPIVA